MHIASRLVNIKESHKPILETNPVLVVFLEGLAVDVLFTINSTEASPVSETGEASTEFTVNKKTSVIKPSSDKNTTNTGLVSNIGLWISLMFTSLDAMCSGLICRKRKMK